MSSYQGYVNPLARASVSPERIDMGVDYAGTGNLVAMGNGVVTQINPGGWGQYGNFMAYQLTDGPYAGQTVYYAEGITPASGLAVGSHVTAGQVLASLIPGWHSGIELGFGGSGQDTTFAQQHGGYTEGQTTASGLSFSNLVKQLGGAPGRQESSTVVGQAPGQGGGNIITDAIGAAGSAIGTVGNAITGVPGDIAGAVGDALSSLFDSIVQKAKYAALAAVAILAGFYLLGHGVKRTVGAET